MSWSERGRRASLAAVPRWPAGGWHRYQISQGRSEIAVTKGRDEWTAKLKLPTKDPPFRNTKKSYVQQLLLYKGFNWNNLQACLEKAMLIGSAKLKCWAAIYISCTNSHMGQEPKKTSFPVARNEDGAFSLYIRYSISQNYFLTFEKPLFVAEVRLTDSRETVSNCPHKFYSQKKGDSIPGWFGWWFYCCQSIRRL